MEWGTAFDGERIYASITNHHHIPYTLTEDGEISQHDRHRRLVGGARSGDWKDPLANGGSAGRDLAWRGRGRRVGPRAGDRRERGGLRVVDGEAREPEPDVRTRRRDREILWQFGAGSSVNAGPAVVNGSVYWGSGYSRSGVEGSGNNQFYAFSIDRR